jgi:uncharacterized protein YqfA (UPF0365 family)
MGKRSRRRSPATASRQPAKSLARRERPKIVHTSVYLPEAVHEALREAAFKERVKIHDIIMEGIGLALRRRGYPR